MEEIGCNTDTGGTAFVSFLYHVSNKLTSVPTSARLSRSICNSEDTMYVGIGRYPYFWPKNTYTREPERY